jgi:hypothetical protein
MSNNIYTVTIREDITINTEVGLTMIIRPTSVLIVLSSRTVTV